jgi:threonine synthase
VLYPKGRVTSLQERQIAGLGKNITALAVEGSFDDCQRLVKVVLADDSLKKKMSLSSANSINVSRLIPQAVYYSAAAGRAFAGLVDSDGEATPRTGSKTRSEPAGFQAGLPVIFCVPSGNFGNLTAGLYAVKMGAPIEKLIAATNINKTVPDYLDSGEYLARLSKATISNAMDVGAPSNFERMSAHFSWEQMKKLILGVSVIDSETRETIVKVHEEAGYFIDPHSAVGWKGVDKLRSENKIAKGGSGNPIGILCTAHPAKFIEIVEPLAGKPPVPSSLADTMKRKVNSSVIPADVSSLVEILQRFEN